MLLSDGQMNCEDCHLMLTEKSLLNFALTHESIVNREIDLSDDESFDTRSASKFLDVITLLPIGICMKQKCRPSLFDFSDQGVNRTSHVLKIELVIHLLPYCPWAIIIEIYIISVQENVHEILLWTPATFVIETVFGLHSANHRGDKVFQIELVSECCAGFVRQLLAVVVPSLVWIE